MPKLSEREVEFVKFLGELGVSYRRIARVHLRSKISHTTVGAILHGKYSPRLYNCQETLQGDGKDMPSLVRDELEETQSHEPQNFLNFENKGLGSYVSTADRHRILESSPCGTHDIGLRSRIVDQFIKKDEPKKLKKLLEKASRKLSLLGLQRDYYVSNQVGVLMRRLYKLKAKRKKNINYKKTTDTVIGYICQWLPSYEAKIKSQLKIDSKLLKEIYHLTGIPAQRV